LAINGKEALYKYEKKQFDVVLSDVKMPKMDGIEFARRIKEIEPNQKILIISAQNMPEFLLEAIELNIDGYLLKPIDKEKLFGALLKVLKALKAEIVLKNYQNELKTELEKKTQELKNIYFTDKITGLPNREALNETLEKKNEGVIYIDIDNFETINLLYGFEIGDRILRKFGEYLSKQYKDTYSLGGDKFVILHKKDGIENEAKKLHKFILDFKTFIQNSPISLTASISFSTKKPLLKTASLALEDLRKKGKNVVGGYNENLEIERLHRRIEKYLPILKDNIKDRSVVPFFQPIVEAQTKRIVKYEALVRIFDKKGKLYPAFEFIEVANVSGLISEVTKIMIEKSFKIAKKKNQEISINISSNDLNDKNFLPFVENKLKKNSLEPSKITFEILEGVVNENIKDSKDVLSILKEMGFKIAIDDFGAKYSNFERIHSINADFIKIDGKYIKDIDINPKSYEITKAIANFAKSVNVEVVAEFVSKKEICQIVKELGIRYMQGYYFSEPKREIE